MRVLKFLLIWSVVIVVVATIAFFISREIFLSLGVSSVRGSLNQLKQAYVQGTYVQNCSQRGSRAVTGESLVTLQLRFLSDTEYVLEAVCNQFELTPITIEQKTLPAFITKKQGTSGFIWQEFGNSAIELAVFEKDLETFSDLFMTDLTGLERTRILAVSDRVISTGGSESLLTGGPITSCVGFGYQCCDTTTEMGTGEQITGLSDCRDQCFSQCVTRPIVLAFTSSPFFNPKTRTVSISPGEVVDFNYVADNGGANGIDATLDFGDGIQAQLEGENGQASHVYECSQANCTYQAILSLEDSWGVSSARSPISTITIQVQR